MDPRHLAVTSPPCDVMLCSSVRVWREVVVVVVVGVVMLRMANHGEGVVVVDEANSEISSKLLFLAAATDKV